MAKHSHAIEKLTMVLECLATHQGDVRERVVCAYSICAHLKVEELPQTCRDDWAWIMKEITKRGPLKNYKGEVWRGSAENTMKHVRKATAVKIAKKFYKVYWGVSENTQYT